MNPLNKGPFKSLRSDEAASGISSLQEKQLFASKIGSKKEMSTQTRLQLLNGRLPQLELAPREKSFRNERA